MTSNISSNFYFLVPESFHTNLVQIGTVVSEKIKFQILYVHDLGPRSRNDIDLQYSHTFIYSIRCLLLPTSRLLATIVSEKSTFFTFSYRNVYESKRKAMNRNWCNQKAPYDTKFDLVVKLVKVTPGSSLEQFTMDWSPHCYIPSFLKIGPPVLKKKIFEGFLPYMSVAAILVM